jgi:hypothetical protein
MHKAKPSRLLTALLERQHHTPSPLWLWRADNWRVYKALI